VVQSPLGNKLMRRRSGRRAARQHFVSLDTLRPHANHQFSGAAVARRGALTHLSVRGPLKFITCDCVVVVYYCFGARAENENNDAALLVNNNYALLGSRPKEEGALLDSN